MTAVQETTEMNFPELVRKHQTGLWRYLRFLGASTAEAEDLVQETFLALWRADFEVRTPEATAAYLRKVARHQLLAVRRRQGRELNTVHLESVDPIWTTLADDDRWADYKSALRECLRHVDGHVRQAIDGTYRDGWSRQQLAQELKMKPEGIKTLLRRARQSLRACVERKVNLKNDR